MFTFIPDKFLQRLVGVVATFMLIHLVIQHFQFIFFEYPLEYRENTDLYRAYLLSIGKNIFAYDNFPSSHSQYGFVYPWLASKLLSYTGIHFYPLRLITALAILPLLGLFIWQGVKEKLILIHLFLICGIIYASYLIEVNNISAVPNTLGLAFFCFSVLIPPLMRFNNLSLIVSCVFAGLGFFTKIYFGFGAFYILLYLIVNKEWVSFRLMLMCLIFTVISSIVIAANLMPAFYETNIALNVTLSTWKPNLIWLQTRFFIEVFFGFFVLIAFYKWFCPESEIFTLKNPYLFGLVLSSLILIKMGANEGAFFLYFHHLLMPFLVPLSIQIISASNKKVTITILLFLNLLYIYSLDLKHNDLHLMENSFHEIENKTSVLDPKADILYNSPTSYYAIKLKKTPNEQGQVWGLSASEGEAGARYRAKINSIHENIRNRKYHQIFVDEWQTIKLKSLSDCYSKSETFEIVMYAQRNKTEMWLPKSQCSTK